MTDLDWMIGASIGQVQLVEPGSWWFQFAGGGSIRADTVWRLVVEGAVRMTSHDHGHHFGRPTPVDSVDAANRALSTLQVRRASIVRDTGDLVLEFEDGPRLEILTTSSGYESWSVFSQSGEETIALGGGHVSGRPAER
jgi:hypothetical protein